MFHNTAQSYCVCQLGLWLRRAFNVPENRESVFASRRCRLVFFRFLSSVTEVHWLPLVFRLKILPPVTALRISVVHICTYCLQWLQELLVLYAGSCWETRRFCLMSSSTRFGWVSSFAVCILSFRCLSLTYGETYWSSPSRIHAFQRRTVLISTLYPPQTNFIHGLQSIGAKYFNDTDILAYTQPCLQVEFRAFCRYMCELRPGGADKPKYRS